LGRRKLNPEIIPDLIRAHFKLTPRAIIESLDLRRPIYKKTAAYGHFGRSDPDFTWELTDKAVKLASDAGVREPGGSAQVAGFGRRLSGFGDSPTARRLSGKWGTAKNLRTQGPSLRSG